MNNTVQMKTGDMVVITGRNFHGLMDAEVKASSLKVEWSGGSCLEGLVSPLSRVGLYS